MDSTAKRDRQRCIAWAEHNVLTSVQNIGLDLLVLELVEMVEDEVRNMVMDGAVDDVDLTDDITADLIALFDAETEETVITAADVDAVIERFTARR